MLIQWLRDGGNVGIHGGGSIHLYTIRYPSYTPSQMQLTARENAGMSPLSPIMPRRPFSPQGFHRATGGKAGRDDTYIPRVNL
jgi:hypothetical protein